MDKPIEHLDEVPVDENGFDLSIIDYRLSLTPAQRLKNAQAFANSILRLRCALEPQRDTWDILNGLIDRGGD